MEMRNGSTRRCTHNKAHLLTLENLMQIECDPNKLFTKIKGFQTRGLFKKGNSRQLTLYPSGETDAQTKQMDDSGEDDNNREEGIAGKDGREELEEESAIFDFNNPPENVINEEDDNDQIHEMEPVTAPRYNLRPCRNLSLNQSDIKTYNVDNINTGIHKSKQLKGILKISNKYELDFDNVDLLLKSHIKYLKKGIKLSLELQPEYCIMQPRHCTMQPDYYTVLTP
jgi:hypothetical protein